MQGYVKFLREKAASVDDEGMKLHRSRRMQLLARKLEIEVQRLTGELLPAEDIAQGWARLAAAFRARMLALPAKLAAKLAAETDPNFVKARLEDEIYTALEELAAHRAILAPLASDPEAENGAGDRNRRSLT